ncbi:hypothetical protein MKW92_011610 [Papaver armeniacum]|nr:hypothetical protein MKW92_011610 [Papaver armeniacum]
MFMELGSSTLARSILTVPGKEKDQSFQAAKDELKKAQENVCSLESRIRLLHSKKLMYSDKGRSLLLQGLV